MSLNGGDAAYRENNTCKHFNPFACQLINGVSKKPNFAKAQLNQGLEVSSTFIKYWVWVLVRLFMPAKC